MSFLIHLSRLIPRVQICNKWLDMPGRVDTWDDIGKGKDFPDLTGVTSVDAMNYIGSQIMYHEVMHHSRFKRRLKPFKS